MQLIHLLHSIAIPSPTVTQHKFHLIFGSAILNQKGHGEDVPLHLSEVACDLGALWLLLEQGPHRPPQAQGREDRDPVQQDHLCHSQGKQQIIDREQHVSKSYCKADDKSEILKGSNTENRCSSLEVVQALLDFVTI